MIVLNILLPPQATASATAGGEAAALGEGTGLRSMPLSLGDAPTHIAKSAKTAKAAAIGDTGLAENTRNSWLKAAAQL